MSDTSVWAIKGGRAGEADALFLKKNVVAVGWEVGDLSALAPTREAFKAAVAKAWPAKTAGSVASDAGQLFRFVHEMQTGDLVAYPSKIDRHVYVGRVDGPYHFHFDPTPQCTFRPS